ncbi:hypothetical protein E4U59_004368 [Claviceps monticola]|nr:hypothetical protein E4U59_004368 [Claviceps monticola]
MPFISGATSNIYEDPEKLFRMFCGYLMINDYEQVVTMPVNLHATELTNLELEPEPEPESIVCQRAIVCRATTCFRAKLISDPEYDRVFKYSWTSRMPQLEADLLSIAYESNIKGIVKCGL